MASPLVPNFWRVPVDNGIENLWDRDVALKVAFGVPEDALLIETDAPWLAPVPHRGKPNAPAYVRDTANFVAELRGVPFEALAEQTSRNFYTLFQRAVRT